MIVKSTEVDPYVDYLTRVFFIMKHFDLRLNLKKCFFGGTCG